VTLYHFTTLPLVPQMREAKIVLLSITASAQY